jgi:hypothetical protein
MHRETFMAKLTEVRQTVEQLPSLSRVHWKAGPRIPVATPFRFRAGHRAAARIWVPHGFATGFLSRLRLGDGRRWFFGGASDD